MATVSPGSTLHRIRWRRRGAWLWPTFIAFTIAYAVIGHELPPQGETQSLVAAGLLAAVLNLVGIILLSRPLGALLRRTRPDLPKVVARDVAGRCVILAITATLTLVGLVHHPAIVRQQRTMRDAITRAQAWIGDRAPAEFRRNVQYVNTFTIEAGHLYRTCVLSDDRRRSYCVVVNVRLPFERSVSFAGYEPNAIFAAGTG
jgi:hypothetical protein